jgi:NarL family two-component system response regulator LiaR
MKPIRIVVVEDQNVVRDGVVTILSFQKDMKVVGEGGNGLEAVELARRLKPDVVLLDLVMPKLTGQEAIPRIKQASPTSQILVLTSYSERGQAYQCIKAGAIGYLLKDAKRDQLLQAIRDVSTGQVSMSPAIASQLVEEINHPTELMYTPDPLTPREMETLKLIARGLTNQEIAAHLGVHERTVAKYVSSILSKLHLANRTQVALYAVREGLAEEQAPPPKQ